MRRSSLVSLVIAVGLVAAVSVVHAAPDNPPRPPGQARGLVVGQPPPPLAVTRLAGNDAVTLTGLGGQVVVLDFWATWCRPCRAIMPVLDAMYRQHHGQGLTVLGLSPEPDAMIRAHLAARPVSYTVAQASRTTVQDYGVRGIPTLVVLDRSGDVREVMVGVDAGSVRRLDALVQQLLAEPAP